MLQILNRSSVHSCARRLLAKCCNATKPGQLVEFCFFFCFILFSFIEFCIFLHYFVISRAVILMS